MGDGPPSLARRRGAAAGAAVRAGVGRRFRPVAALADGNRCRLRPVVQPPAWADRITVVRSRGVFRPWRLRGHPLDARDQRRLAVADAGRPPRRRRDGAGLRHVVRRPDDASRGRRVRADFARSWRARLCRHAHVPGLFRRRGRHHGQSRRRPAPVRPDVRVAAPGLLCHRNLGIRRHCAHGRFPAHAAGAHVQRRARQSRARRIHRLRSGARAPCRVLDRRHVRRARWRAACAQLRDRRRGSGRRRVVPARCS